MTNTIQSNCAYCGTKSVAFQVHMPWVVERSGNGPYRYTYDSLAICAHCGRASLVELSQKRTNYQEEFTFIKTLGRTAHINDIKPRMSVASAPAHTPDSVAKLFKQGVDNITLRNWDAAGMMFRKSLEIGLAIQLNNNEDEDKNEGEGESEASDKRPSLFDQIDKMRELGKLPLEMAEWAHQIRQSGNDAAHEEFDEKRAKDIYKFTELLFQYMFTLPGMMEEYKGPNKNT